MVSSIYKYSLVSILFLFLCCKSLANHGDISVGLEPFPPLVNEDGTGFVINMLNALEENSSLRFDYQIMTYARAKRELKKQRIDMIGLTPKGQETEEFYQYAQELIWHFDTTVDFYSTSPSNFTFLNFPQKSVGTLIGNADFFSELSSISRDKFIEVSSLKQLIMMMARGRIKVILFERVAMMSTIHDLQKDLNTKVPSVLNSQKIYYQKFKRIPASIAVANSTAGIKLKRQLDKLLANNTSQYFAKIAPYAQLPDQGVIK
jgi:polar amino acid transport system substrate-binding protein